MKLTWLIAALACVTLCLGCGGKDKEKSKADKRYEPDTQVADNTNTEVVTPSTDEGQSPASATAQHEIDKQALPDDIVRAFIMALNENDSSLAEALLTDIARVETKKAELVVQQPWSPEASYQLGNVEYATGHPIRAEVVTTWDDPSTDTITAPQYTIVWMLFKQPHNGWRICGMKTDFIPNGEMVYLNFEDPADMISRWEQGLLDAAEQQSEIRSADAGQPANRR